MSADESFDWLTLTEGESMLWSGHPRKKSILKTVAVVLVVVVLIGVFARRYALPAALLGALLVGWGYLRILNTDYVLTDRSVYRKTGVLGESVERASLSKIQNTDLSKGVLGAQFGFGTVEVSTAGSSGADLRIANVNDPDRVRGLLSEYTKQSEGVGMDAMGAGDPASTERALEQARRLREVAESLEETFAGGEP